MAPRYQLRTSVPLGEGETAMSLLSRLAVLHRSRSAQQFAADVGLNHRRISDGHRSEVSALAALAGVDAVALLSNSPQRHVDGYFSIRNCTLSSGTSKRSSPQVCPICILDDVSSLPNLPLFARAFGRYLWLARPIQTCFDHNCALVDVERTVQPEFVHDFSANVEGFVGALERGPFAASIQEPSPFERYLHDRLGGTKLSPSLINDMELFAAAKTCELFGASLLFGKQTALRTLRADQYRAACNEGFSFLGPGGRGLEGILDEFRLVRWPERARNGGAQAILGGLVYDWLQRQSQHVTYRPLKQRTAAYFYKHIPIKSGARLFGVPFYSRQVHSVHSAAKAYGVHEKTIEKIAKSAGIARYEIGDDPGARLIIDAKAADDLIGRSGGLMKLRNVGEYIGAPKNHFDFMHRHGLIVPIAKGGGHKQVNGRYFARTDVDALMDRLLQGAELVEALAADMVDMRRATRVAHRPIVEILDAILDGKFSWRGRLAGARPYEALLLKRAELLSLFHTERPGLLTHRQTEARLAISNRVLVALTADGILMGHRVRHPLTHQWQTIFRESDVEKFQEQYVSLTAVRKEFRANVVTLKSRLLEISVLPALDAEKYYAEFYHRSDITTFRNQKVLNKSRPMSKCAPP